MKKTAAISLIGGAIAFLLVTACCWLPIVALTLGGAAGLAGFTQGLEGYSGLLMGLGAVLIGSGGYQLYNKKKSSGNARIILTSTLTCPKCSFQKEEKMPTNACVYFYECANCNEVIKPKEGDCCVYCSYGTMPCPPIQQGEACC